MSKNCKFEVGEFHFDKFTKPIRTKKDLIFIFLEAMNAILLNNNIQQQNRGTITVIIEKMSRIFFDFDEKRYSFIFPFGLDQRRDEDAFDIVEPYTDSVIDYCTISCMKSILANVELSCMTFEELIDQAYFNSFDETYDAKQVDRCCMLLTRLFVEEWGYIRYDYDVEHQNGDRHPLNHLDVNFSSRCTYKLGLKKEMKMDELIDLVDIQTDCRYVV